MNKTFRLRGQHENKTEAIAGFGEVGRFQGCCSMRRKPREVGVRSGGLAGQVKNANVTL